VKFAFLGMSRTATMSTWNLLKNHPDISVSVPKEFIRIHSDDISNYIQKAHMNNMDVKVYLDGSPQIFTKRKKFERTILELKRQGFTEFKQLYSIRNPLDRVISVYNLNFLHIIRHEYPTERMGDMPINSNLEIDRNKLMISCKYLLNEYHFLRTVERYIGKDNIFLVNIDDIGNRQKEIYNFLGVDSNVEYSFMKTNTKEEIGFHIKQLKFKLELIKWIEQNRNTLEKMIRISNNKILERYG